MEDTTPSELVAKGATALISAAVASQKGKTMNLTTVYDCMGSNLGKFPVPTGVLLAGYVTGQGGVPWTDQQFAAHPNAVRIDQSPIDTPADETADVADAENQAVTLTDLPQWATNATHNYLSGARPGQRAPTIYAARTTITPVVNTLIAAGITKGVNLWIAEEATFDQAAAEVTAASGPFPVVGRQYAFLGDHDVSVFSTQWLINVSGKPQTPPPGPGTQSGWRFCIKCQSLFYGPGQAISACAKGGQHDGSRSHDYTLGFVL